MSRTDQELEGVTLLGNQGTQYEFDYRPDVLETFENKHPENEYVVTLDCPEVLTSELDADSSEEEMEKLVDPKEKELLLT